MKKIFSLLIIFGFISANSAFAIEDELVKMLDGNLKVKKQAPVIYKDEFASRTLDKNLKIQSYSPVIYRDNMAEALPKNFNYAIGNKKQKFDFESLDETLVKISPEKYYTTRTTIKEGDIVNFVLVEDVNIKNKLYKKGTKVTGRIENISMNGAYGVPADLVVDNFVLANDIKLNGAIEKKGANRTIWLYPTSTVMCMFFGAGLLLLPIRGGHAKLRPSKVYELKYN